MPNRLLLDRLHVEFYWPPALELNDKSGELEQVGWLAPLVSINAHTAEPFGDPPVPMIRYNAALELPAGVPAVQAQRDAVLTSSDHLPLLEQLAARACRDVSAHCAQLDLDVPAQLHAVLLAKVATAAYVAGVMRFARG
jgi:hypothetical protein